VSELPPEELTPAEQRLLALLLLLASDGVRSDAALVRRVMTSLRWQRTVRELLMAVGSLAAAVVDGMAALVRRPGRGSRSR
jgi:hypothetical protein